MEVSRITSRLSFRADSTPAVTTSNVTLEPAPAEKKSHTGLIVGGVVLAAALAGYAIYRRKSPKAVADEAKIVKTTKEMDETSKQYQKKIKEFEEEQVKTNKEMKAIIQNVNGATQKTAHKVKRATASTMDKIVNDLEAFWSKHPAKKENIGKSIKTKDGYTIKYFDHHRMVYDKDGKLISNIAPYKGSPTISGFDKEGRLVRYKTATQNNVKIAYDKNGKPISFTDWNWVKKDEKSAKQKLIVWQIEYNSEGQLVTAEVGERKNSAIYKIEYDNKKRPTTLSVTTPRLTLTYKKGERSFRTLLNQATKIQDTINEMVDTYSRLVKARLEAN